MIDLCQYLKRAGVLAILIYQNCSLHYDFRFEGVVTGSSLTLILYLIKFNVKETSHGIAMASKLAGCQYSCFRFHRYEPVIAYLFIFIKGCFFWFPLHLKTTALCRAARQIAVFTACVETRQFL